MNLYLILIGIISMISCVLIIICINSKSVDPESLPSDGSKSPLPSRGLTDTQKSQILLIVCVIFFMSLITTNVKTSKFSVIFSNMIQSFSEQASIQQVTDFRKFFYGSKGNCEFMPKNQEYPHLFKYLKEAQIENRFMSELLQKNFGEILIEKESKSSGNQTQQSKQRLMILSSNIDNKDTEVILPLLSQNICKSSVDRVPVLYLNLNEKVESQQRLMSLLKIGSYDSLKQSICKLNGIQVLKEIEKVGTYLVEKQTYSPSGKAKTQDRKAYLIINNFHFLDQVLIFSQNVILNQDFQRQRDSYETVTSPISLKPQYELFIDKLLNDLVKNCKINLILQTDQQKEVSKLYENWKKFIFHTQKISNLVQSVELDEFPFDINIWKGITKLQFVAILKEIISSSKLKTHENLVWRNFEKAFGKVLNPILKSSIIQTDSTQYMRNDQQITLTQIQNFFVKIEAEIEKDNEKSINRKLPKITDLKSYVAQFYGLDKSFELIQSFSNSKSGHKAISIGSLKKKIPIEEIRKLQQYGLISIKDGKVFLSN